ncbi:CarD family transcriptional regulator [Psychrobacillus sp. OK032]|uniref:CarD family transcriptional regulator n=1 Tax=Psychrobacillus sp. OK032 TaxID=1884358 RepID=UPI0008B4DBF2|nr:CarD family transcriptional regulator [Psychrobacillus sp. OK032]SES31292.1 transcriptional regulator, CarD family [Psychrobacillus sp. OK032]
MFNVGDIIIYSAHGLCKIDDICEKTYGDNTRNYYVLHPLENSKLIINIPVDSEQVVMQKVVERDEAEDILQSFQQPGIEWIENAKQRTKQYNSLVNTGDRKEIAKVANTLMRKKREANKNKEKMYDHDRVLLTSIQNTMFKELALSLNTTYGEISTYVKRMISQYEVT